MKNDQGCNNNLLKSSYQKYLLHLLTIESLMDQIPARAAVCQGSEGHFAIADVQAVSLTFGGLFLEAFIPDLNMKSMFVSIIAFLSL
ncbi:hypothetical protein V2J09_013762 [Rumex salicifolius]